MSHTPLFSEICVKYVEWVSRNPQTTSEIESAMKWMSYFLAGRVSNSTVISELVYSVSNLVVLFNDSIIRRTQSLHHFGSADKIKTWLTVLEYCEVFIEVSTGNAWGATGRWIIVTLVQIFKCVARLALLYRYKESIIQHPPVPPLRRSEVNNLAVNAPPEGFTLKSGRVIRTVDAGAPAAYRSWTPPEVADPTEDAILTQRQMMGEMLFVAKPLTHLATLYHFGSQDWRPWLIAFSLDIASMHLLKSQGCRKLSRRQNLELTRRQISLLLYLLRSPFYESHTRDRLARLMESASSSLPLVGIILRPLAQYLPHWQRTYFYMWSA